MRINDSAGCYRHHQEEKQNKMDKMWLKWENNHTQKHIKIDYQAHVGAVIVVLVVHSTDEHGYPKQKKKKHILHTGAGFQ